MSETDSIFLLNEEDRLVRVPHTTYASEDLLQSLLEKHPELIVGDQINSENPPRWMVVSREAGIPDADGAANRWSVDHLLLDQLGRPTFVEVKRSSDTRIRREVVGQMLDYAANALAYWPQDRIRALAADNLGGLEQLDEYLTEFLGLDVGGEEQAALEDYWVEVEKNLREGEVRLLFVADTIPTELKRIIEFLNEHMPRVEVLGVEIRQYGAQGLRALVPRVFGQTESARQQKVSNGPRPDKINESDFIAAYSGEERDLYQQVLSEARELGYTISWGTAAASLRLPNEDGRLTTFFWLWPGALDAYLNYISDERAKPAVRAALNECIPFSPSGEHTLRLALDEKGRPALKQGLTDMLKIPIRLQDGDFSA